ncbi:MAG: fibronectin type III domain-containing protein [Acidobacteriota bacterium]|nr:fibronectin type III domain-containing protein [Acidobacteriota bacterium]
MSVRHRKSSIAVVAAVVVCVAGWPLLAGATGGVARPTAPRSVHASAGNASASVTWVRPASNGGAPITRYVVTAHPSGRTCTSKSLKCTVGRLRNGTTYYFTVVAHNSVGNSPSSKASNRVKPKAPTTSRKLVVVPSTGLINGQSVKVSGTGFTPNDQVYLVECLNTASGQGGCNIATATPVTITGSGTLPTTSFVVVTGTVGSGSCGTSSSNLSSCAVSAGNAAGGDSASAPISFKSP